ncbi:MAG: serine/threonine-protein kinase [Acidobacteriota bacterium]
MVDETNDSTLVRQVYAGALRHDPEEREGYLARACAGKPGLREKVAALLAAHARDSVQTMTVSPPGYQDIHPQQPEVEGRVVGPYIIRRELGRGGMGVVYLADDTRLSRRVALKALNEQLNFEPGGRDRLRREARAAAALTHPGIATVYAIEEIDERLYISCEYVPGEPLRALVKSGPIPIDQVVDIGAQLARALAAAHTAGIVHRDIKPENIIRTPSGVVKVLDFGLARSETAPFLSQTGVVLGTPAYLAPEQALGHQADFRSDLFALGLVLYELASGINPFAASTITGTLARIVEGDPVPLSHVQPAAVPELERIVGICLQKDPLLRYGSTQELVGELEALAVELTEQKRSSSHHSRPVYRVRGQPRWWWEVHQITVSVIYLVMLYPAWRVRTFLPSPWGMLFFLALLAAAAAATSFRLNLWFVSHHFPVELPAQRARTWLPIRVSDATFGGCLLIAAFAIAGGHPEFAVLLVAVSIAMLVTAFVIEPTTARVAFPPAAPASSASSRG